MTVLDFDPPQSSLRLVSTNGTSTKLHNRSTNRLRTGAPLRGDARRLYREVLQAALVWGDPIDADALRVVLATKQSRDSGPTRAFTGSGIWQLMFVDVVAWCQNRKLDVPDRCAQALSTTISYLEASETLHSTSDDVDDLHDAIDECTGGWCEPHPSTPAGARRSLRSRRGPKRS